jgi:hypothetical protein
MESGDVRRGVFRWLARAGIMPLAEVRLGCGRRADILGVDAAGRLTLIEIKVALADLRGDRKWPEYLDWCDRFFWAVPESLVAAVAAESFAPERTGVLVADRFDAALLREAPLQPLSAARRKAQTLRFARAAACRLALAGDPEIMAFAEV